MKLGDLVGRRGTGRQQAIVGDQLGGDRIGVAGGGGLRVGPAVGADRRDRIGRLRQRQARRPAARATAKRRRIESRMPAFLARLALRRISRAPSFSARTTNRQNPRRGPCSRDRSSL